jgi:hypothetical protein
MKSPDRQPLSKDAVIQMRETTLAAIEYADTTLQTSSVHVQIVRSEAVFNPVSPDITEVMALSAYGPATSTTALDLNVQYDRGAMVFDIIHAKLNLNNGCAIEFAEVPLWDDPDLYYVHPTDPFGKSLLTVTTPKFLPRDETMRVLSDSGINVPTAPQRADWNSIEGLLEFAEHWRTTATHVAPLDLTTSLRVEDTVQAGALLPPDDKLALSHVEGKLGDAWVREIELSVDRARDAVDRLPSTAISLTARSDSPRKRPRYVSLRHIPLTYEPEFLGQLPTIRIADPDQAIVYQPEHPNFDAMHVMVRACIEEASRWSDD